MAVSRTPIGSPRLARLFRLSGQKQSAYEQRALWMARLLGCVVFRAAKLQFRAIDDLYYTLRGKFLGLLQLRSKTSLAVLGTVNLPMLRMVSC